MHEFIAFIGPLLSCFFLLRILRPKEIAESVLTFFSVFTAHIIFLGYMLSYINHLGDVRYWSILGLISASASGGMAILNRDIKRPIQSPRAHFGSLIHFIRSVKNWYIQETSLFEKLLLTPLILATVILGMTNLVVIVFTAPHNWDSMTYHLARVAYYLQHNNINYFSANFWAQVVHFKNSSLLLLYTYLISGRNENLTQLVQFASYWAAICGIYAISMKVGNNRNASLFAATISALLIDWLMEATTTQNDMLITAYFGVVVYFLFAFRKTHEYKHLVLAGLGIGLSLGTKGSSFLVLPSVALIALYTLFGSKDKFQSRVRDGAVFAVCTLLAICMFALPAGYIENYRHFGHPIGIKVARAHSFEGESINYIFRNGTKNLIRFGLEFLSLDGLPESRPIRKVQAWMRNLPQLVLLRLGIDLETSEATREPFTLKRHTVAHEDTAYWGVLGFGLIWIVVLLSVIGVMKFTETRVLSLAAVLFFLSQAYAGPYDPWRGRFFITCAVFAVPVIGISLQAKNRFVRSYLFLIILIGCASAVSAVVLRNTVSAVVIRYNIPPVSKIYKDMYSPSIFTMDRMKQLTRNRIEYHEPLKAFDEFVPSDATVAVFLNGDSFEYPLFGKGLSRTIIPINSFDKGLQPISSNAEYLLYTKGFPCAASADMSLGADWYLRKLTGSNRRCP